MALQNARELHGDGGLQHGVIVVQHYKFAALLKLQLAMLQTLQARNATVHIVATCDDTV
jgi:hypothetical protein